MVQPSDDNPQSTIHNPQSAIPRRDFLALAGRGALWTALAASTLALIRFLGFAEPEPPKTFTLEMPNAYPFDALTPVAGGRAFIVRDERGLYALLATCTHLGCLVEHRVEGFACPCHGSRFDKSGVVTHGPAARPLARAALTIGSDGRVVLDVGKTVDPGERLSAGGAN
jgi:cytochrome b6-f complex iron-sulfur subunit